MGFRVLMAEISHETNTFNIHPTDLRAFHDRYLLTGDDAVARRGTANTELAGFLDAGRAHGWRITHVLSAAAGPSGPVTRAAFEALAGPVLAAAAGGNFDGVLLGLHGAMVTDFCDDGEGELLRRLRLVIGRGLPVAVTLDPHANVTVAMCDLADILVSFTTYPHVDMRDTARRTGDILHRTMADEIRPRTVRVHRPMLEEVNGGRTDIGPMIARAALARAYEARPDVFAVSINAGFASADIAEVGPTVLVTGEGDLGAHTAFADSIADDIWTRRGETLNEYLTVDEAAAIAADWDPASGPLVIADYADNPGGGAYGDGTALLAVLLRAGVSDACFGPMIDGAAAQGLQDAPIGGTVRVRLGGRTNPDMGGGPLDLEGEVLWRGEGAVTGDGPILGGLVQSFGPSAVLGVAGIDILITTIAHQMLDLQQFRTFGIDPARRRVVALKSMQHFRAAFQPIAARIIVCDSGALCTLRYETLAYRNVSRPIFPLDLK